MTIHSFEDIQAWQAARELTRMVYAACREGKFARDVRLVSQIQSAAVSAMSNIAEGFDAASDPDFSRFLVYSRRSATEVQSQLYVALDAGYVDQAAFKRLYDKATDVKKLVNGFLRYLRSAQSRDKVLAETSESDYLSAEGGIADHPPQTTHPATASGESAD